MDTATAVKPPSLRIADRCDQCGAQAFVRATFTASELLFCMHHGRFHEAALLLQGADLFFQEVSQRENDTDH